MATRIADAPESYQFHTTYQAPGWGDWGTMMILGMALYRYGFLTGKWSRRAYGLTALIGLGISLPLAGWYTWYMWHGNFEPMHVLPLDFFYDTARVSGTLGNAGLLMLLITSGWFKGAFRLLANVGQTALSNYILTSLTMQTLFVWSPLHWFGYVEYYKAYLLVVCMWIANLTLSHFWLKRFQFGPLEWLWRSLTYWKKQPMLLQSH